jgi:glutaredoxin 3
MDQFYIMVEIDELAKGSGDAAHQMRNDMVKVEIYTTIACPFCTRAVNLLSAKNIDLKKIDVTLSTAKRRAMRIRANGQTSVPQIFINDDHIGGCDDLFRLDQAGHLDKLLSIAS